MDSADIKESEEMDSIFMDNTRDSIVDESIDYFDGYPCELMTEVNDSTKTQ